MKLKRFLNASMILAFLAMSQTALAQAFTVQGRVVDESGEPMIGVAVTNKDGNTLGVTDADGRYSIELNSPTKLKFTFVGSETITIDAKKATQKYIVMRQTATALDDVVVVKPRQVLRLTQEVAAIVGAKRTVTHGEHTQSVSATHIAQEKLFYRHHGR